MVIFITHNYRGKPLYFVGKATNFGIVLAIGKK